MTEGSTAAGGGANTVGTSFLAAASGSADVITFLTLGHVFGSAMTGNTALLGIAYAAGALLAGLLEWSAFALLTWMPAAAVVLALTAFEVGRGRTAGG